jgi:hypothetical protein
MTALVQILTLFFRNGPRMRGLLLAQLLRRKASVHAPESDTVFRVLDGHQFSFEGDPCQVEVFGVYDDGEHRWLQLALDGGEHQKLVTLRLSTTNCRDCALVSFT